MAGRKRLIKNVNTASRPKAKKYSRKKDDTLTIDDIIEKIVEEGIQKYQDELETLSGKEYVDRFSQLIEYVKPKLSRVEKIGDDNERNFTINLLPSGVSMDMLTQKNDTEDVEMIELGGDDGH